MLGSYVPIVEVVENQTFFNDDNSCRCKWRFLTIKTSVTPNMLYDSALGVTVRLVSPHLLNYDLFAALNVDASR